MRVPRKLMVFGIVALLFAAACGGNDDTGAGGRTEQPAEELSLSIDGPADGSEVQVPFELTASASVPLGAPETGRHHLHVWYDGNANEYEVVNTESVEIADLEPGDHTVTVSLRNADHSEAGADDEISVTVVDAGERGDDTGEGANEQDDGY